MTRPAAVPRSIITAHTGGTLTVHVDTTTGTPPPPNGQVKGDIAGTSVSVESVTPTDTGFVIVATVVPEVATGSWPFGFWATDGDSNVPIAAGTVQVIPNPDPTIA